MDDPVVIAERAYEAWQEHDMVEVLCAFPPDSHCHLDHTGLPYRGDFSGRDGIADVIRDILVDWRLFEVKPSRFMSDRDVVVVTGTYEATAKSTGFAFSEPFVHVWKFKPDGGVWLGVFRTSASAFRALDYMTEAGFRSASAR